MRSALKYQVDAWTAFFKGQRGHPKFKGRSKDESFTKPDDIRIRGEPLLIRKLDWYVLRRRGGNPCLTAWG